VAAYQAMTRWSTDHVPFPGAAARETVRMLVRDNGMINDRAHRRRPPGAPARHPLPVPTIIEFLRERSDRATR
jgi:hypothetical protein